MYVTLFIKMVKRTPRSKLAEEFEEEEEDPLVTAARSILFHKNSLREIIKFGKPSEAKKAIKYWVVLNAIQQDARSEGRESRFKDFLPPIVVERGDKTEDGEVRT